MADSRTLTTDATTAAAGRHRVAGRPVAGASARAALVVVTAGAVLLDAPTWLRTTLTVVTAVVVAEWVVRHRRRGLLDAAVVGAAGLVVAAVLLGLVLNLTPDGLTRSGWAVGAGVLSLGAVAAATRRPMPPGPFTPTRTAGIFRDPGRRTSLLVGAVTSVLAVAVVTVSFVAAAGSTRDNQVAPLVVSSTVGTDGALDLSLSSGTPSGPYDVVVTDGTTATTAATGLTVGSTPTTVIVTLPAGRVLVDVVPTGTATPVRQLIFDDGRPAATDPAGSLPSAATPTAEAPAGSAATVELDAVTTAAGRLTGVTLRSDAVTGPYDLVVVAGGRSTVAAGGFYLDGTARTVPVTVPIDGDSRIELVSTGSTTPVRQLAVVDGRPTP